MELTLEELKRQNAESEAESDTPIPQNEDVENETELDDVADKIETEAETDSNETETPDIESWMVDEEDSNEETEKQFSGNDIANAKHKLKAKLDKRHNAEVEELKAQIKSLESKPVQNVSGRPNREDFYEHDDPDTAYEDALYEWRLNQEMANRQKEIQAKQVEEYKDKTEKALDAHYERANEFVNKYSISPESYKQAEKTFRESIDNVMPNRGDAVADHLISMISGGSERVAYAVGINANKRAELQKSLLEDQTGMKAAIFLGKISQEVSNAARKPVKRNKPAARANGESKLSGSTLERNLKKKYEKAVSSGSMQGRLDARKEARAANIDVSKW